MLIEQRRYLPDTDRVSILTATILLAYALTTFVTIEPRSFSFNLLGVMLGFQINFRTIISVLVAALAASGSDWLMRGHPYFARHQAGRVQTLQHLFLPALTAWAIGIPLNNLRAGLEWWLVLAMGGILLVMVFVAEYSVVDVTDLRHPIAAVGLTALSFALFLLLAIAVRAAGFRLYMALPALIPAAALVSLRALYLRLGGSWHLVWAALIAVIVAQAATGLHYWPLSPVRYGLLVVALTYALTSLAGAFQEGRPGRRWLVEPLVMLAIVAGLAIWLR